MVLKFELVVIDLAKTDDSSGKVKSVRSQISNDYDPVLDIDTGHMPSFLKLGKTMHHKNEKC